IKVDGGASLLNHTAHQSRFYPSTVRPQNRQGPGLTNNRIKPSIQVITRMTKLLDALAQSPQPLSLKQVTQVTHLHPSSAHRILGSMVHAGLVDRIEPGMYRLGIKLLELGNLVKSRINVRLEALPYMQQLHEELGEAVNLSMRHGDEVVYVERTSSGKSMMRVIHVIGARVPLHVSAVGKCFLAHDGDKAGMEYAHRTGLPRLTENSISDRKKLREELEGIRNRGYAFDFEEAEKGVSCIGTGIYGADGSLIAGLSVSAPADRLNKDWALHIRKTSEQISRTLGYKAR
ncbi:MAG TPA: IclR family transcriptional regulator, partial [Acidiferrobacterales bacterium]|nr:IclR family transcriptional regulator [Acidiferrobacterales bacterium]